jgi:hypothetical protein
LVFVVVLDSGDLSGARGNMAGPRVFYYLNYVLYWKVQVEYPPWDGPCAASALSPTTVSSAPSFTR